MSDDPQSPQTEGGEAQTEPAKTYTQADVDRIVSTYEEKVERNARRADRYKTDLEKVESKYGELEKRASQFSETEAGKRIKQLEAERETLAGKYSGLRTDAIASRVASELSADAGLVSTMITGLRSQGVLDREPEDPSEAASAWLDAIREKHGSFFTKPDPDQKPEPEKRQRPKAGIIPAKDDTRPTPEQARQQRADAERKAGRKGVVI